MRDPCQTLVQTRDPTDEKLVWVHRGHIIFSNRDQISRSLLPGWDPKTGVVVGGQLPGPVKPEVLAGADSYLDPPI